MIVRRLVLVLSIVFCGSLALAAAAVAAGGGLGPGTFTFTNKSATAFFGGAKGGPPQPSFSVFVSRGLNSFQPDDGSGPTVMPSTVVQFTEFDPTGSGGSACFIIPDGDFTVAQGLNSAALHTMLTAAELCKGVGSPVGGSSKAAPPGGGGGGLVLPIQVDITWTGSGVVATTTEEFSFTCLQIEEQGSNLFRDAVGSSASGTIGSATGLTTLSADISSQNGTLEVQGSSNAPCFGK